MTPETKAELLRLVEAGDLTALALAAVRVWARGDRPGRAKTSAEDVKEVLLAYAQDNYKPGSCECAFATFRVGGPEDVETLLAIPRRPDSAPSR